MCRSRRSISLKSLMMTVAVIAVGLSFIPRGRPYGSPPIFRPSDRLLVNVVEALPGRPITELKCVGADGKITLDSDGDVLIAGKTVPEAKEAIVEHLRAYLSDATLGLTDRCNDPTHPGHSIPPRDCDNVTIDSEYHHPLTVMEAQNIPYDGPIGCRMAIMAGRARLKSRDTVTMGANFDGNSTHRYETMKAE